MPAPGNSRRAKGSSHRQPGGRPHVECGRLGATNTKAAQQTATRRWLVVIAVVVGAAVLLTGLALVVAGFLIGAGHDEEEFGACECPITKAVAGSIDWAGTGDRPSMSVSVLEDARPYVSLTYGSDSDPTAAFDSLVARLTAAGYEPTVWPSPFDEDLPMASVSDGAQRWGLTFEIAPPVRDDLSPTFRLNLVVRAPDQAAETVLDDLADAVGRHSS